MSQIVKPVVFRHISHKIVIVGALKTVSKTLGITMFSAFWAKLFNYSKQFSPSTDLIAFPYPPPN